MTPAEADACGEEAAVACLWVFRRTDSEVMAKAADWLVARPLKIALIIVLAVLLHVAVQRLIRRFIAGIELATVRRNAGRGISLSEPGSLLATGPLGDRARQRAETIGAVMRNIAKVVVAVMAILMILSELSLDLGPLLAGAGIVGVAVGFGSQTLVRDFLAGMFMLIEDQFGIGDVIDVGEASGVVEGISLRTTRLRDIEGIVWHIPNGEIKRVGNKSQDWSRALLDVQVAHGTDLTKAQEVIKDVADAVWRDESWSAVILDEPEVKGVEGLGSGGITIRLVVKTRPADQWDVLRVLRERIAAAFGEAGIRLPTVQQVPIDPNS